VAVPVGVIVLVGVDVGLGVPVAVGLAVVVSVGVDVAVAVLVAVGVAVPVDVGVGVEVGVVVLVAVAVSVGVEGGTYVLVAVGIAVSVAVVVLVSVGVLVGIIVGVAVSVSVGVAVGWKSANLTLVKLAMPEDPTPDPPLLSRNLRCESNSASGPRKKGLASEADAPGDGRPVARAKLLTKNRRIRVMISFLIKAVIPFARAGEMPDPIVSYQPPRSLRARPSKTEAN